MSMWGYSAAAMHCSPRACWERLLAQLLAALQSMPSEARVPASQSVLQAGGCWDTCFRFRTACLQRRCARGSSLPAFAITAGGGCWRHCGPCLLSPHGGRQRSISPLEGCWQKLLTALQSMPSGACAGRPVAAAGERLVVMRACGREQHAF